MSKRIKPVSRPSRRLRKHRRPLRLETLESRRLLVTVSGVINSDTTWKLTDSPFQLIGDVFVRNGATLTIEAGVQVVENSGFIELNVSDNGSGGTLNANGVTFDADVVFGQNGAGAIQNSTFSSKILSITDNSSPVITGSSFHPGESLKVFPEYVPSLSGQNNSFGTGATIGIFSGVIDVNTTWPNLSDASTYRLLGDVSVRQGAVLTIGSGMQLFDNSGFIELYISDDGSDGTLNADGVTFDADIVFGQDSFGTIKNSTVSGKTIKVTGNAAPVFQDNSFYNGRPLELHPEFVPSLAGRNNTFDTGATIGVLAGVIDVNTNWPNLSDASTYELLGDVSVRQAAVLTIGSGMRLFDNSGFIELYISDDGSDGTLNANGVTFDADVVFGQDSFGSIKNSTVSGKIIKVTGNAAPVFQDNSFYNGRPLEVHPEFVPSLAGRNNTFDTGATIGVLAGVIDVNTNWPNLSDASTYELLGDVSVRQAAVLTIGSGMRLFDNSGFIELYISDDGSDGTLNADGVTFDADVIFGQDSFGSIKNSTVSGKAIKVTGNAAPVFQDNSFYNGRPLEVHPEFVPSLAGRNNTFDTGATIGVLAGVIDVNTNWPNLSDASTYELLGDVSVRQAAVLTIGSGMRLFDNSGFVELYISDDGSAGTLFANGVTFDADVIFGANSGGTIQNSTIASLLITVNTDASPNFIANQFHGGTPIKVFPEYLPRLIGNQFTFGAKVDVLAGNIAVDTTWPVLSGVTTIGLVGDVQVTGDAALTIADGLVVKAQSGFAELFVGAIGLGGSLNSKFVVFDTDVIFGRNSSGAITGSRFIGELHLAGTTTTSFNENNFGTTSVVRGIRDTLGTIDLTNNFWGTSNAANIEAKVDHQPDDPRRPLILFDPFLVSAPAKANPEITWPDPADILVGTSLSAAQLNATANTTGRFTYSPPLGTVLSVGTDQVLSVSFRPSNTLTFNTATAFVEIDVVRTDPVITWPSPASIIFGVALDATQLNATADVAGSFSYTPSSGAVLNAGVGQLLSVTFTPTDAVNFNTVSSNVTIDVAKADPTVSWDTPVDIVFGTALGNVQLNATTTVAGSLIYTPPTGTVLGAGAGQALSAEFTPDDTANYNNVSATVGINVLKADPVITWSEPDSINVGTPLGTTQLNATVNVPGVTTYSPGAGFLLPFGLDQALRATFTPEDFANYNTVTATTQIDVFKIVPSITWNAPDDIVFGTPLSDLQLNATADVAGNFVYVPSLDTVLDAGEGQVLEATFIPNDSATYLAITVAVGIDVLKADPVITWGDPGDIVFGTGLSSTQLDAISDIPGSFVFSPLPGTVLNAGLGQALDVVFTPSDPNQYNSANASVTINVLQATPQLTWSDPGEILVGTALGNEQLNAQADVDGLFSYDPLLGALLPVGDDQTLSVSFQPDDSLNFRSATTTALISVLENLDFGDAPESFGVTLDADGPRHRVGDLFLGSRVDRDLEGQPSLSADGDDDDGTTEMDDEDGYVFVASLVTTSAIETTSSFVINSSAAGKLDAWIDFNGNGTFEAAEHLGSEVSMDVNAGENLISFNVPAGAVEGESFLRLRLSSAGGLSPLGFASDGEVEDHVVTILSGAPAADVLIATPSNQTTLALVSDALSVRNEADDLFLTPINSVNSVQILGTETDDRVTLEFSGGDVIPRAGIQLDGRAGNDALVLRGPASDLDLTDALLDIRSFETIDLTAPGASTLTVDPLSVALLASSNSAQVVGSEGDKIRFSIPTEWSMVAPTIEEGTFFRTVVSGGAVLRVDLPFPFQNLVQRHDVNDDGGVRASDALRIINELSARKVSDGSSSSIVDPLSVVDWPGVYFDVSGDDRITALDALQVINELTRRDLDGASEAEQVFLADDGKQELEFRRVRPWGDSDEYPLGLPSLEWNSVIENREIRQADRPQKADRGEHETDASVVAVEAAFSDHAFVQTLALKSPRLVASRR